jgi:hypothetical protein
MLFYRGIPYTQKIRHLPHFLARLWPFADFDGGIGHQMGRLIFPRRADETVEDQLKTIFLLYAVL